MNRTRWAAVAALLAGLGTPAATASGLGRTQQPEVVTTPLATVVSLTGLAAPTKDAVVAPGTLMSTYGYLRSYDDNGRVLPLVHKYVYVETRPLSNWTAPYKAVSTGVTTSTGYYYAGNWRSDADVDVRVSFVSDNAGAPSKISYLGPVRPRPRPSWLDGVVGPAGPAGPTTVIRVDTKMSAFGHLRVLYSNGRIGPYAGQRVRVQLRPAEQPGDGPDPYFDTVGEAVTTSTGYFYTNWTAHAAYYRNADVYVRLVFPGGYRSVTPSERGLGVIHFR